MYERIIENSPCLISNNLLRRKSDSKMQAVGELPIVILQHSSGKPTKCPLKTVRTHLRMRVMNQVKVLAAVQTVRAQTLKTVTKRIRSGLSCTFATETHLLKTLYHK